MSEKIVKTVGGISYLLMDQVHIARNGKKYINSYWLEGGGVDTNLDGRISNITLECEIPENKQTLDLASLKEECLLKVDNKLVYREPKKEENNG